jgi:hypothetical protein
LRFRKPADSNNRAAIHCNLLAASRPRADEALRLIFRSR